jgi:hypothetical protein
MTTNQTQTGFHAATITRREGSERRSRAARFQVLIDRFISVPSQ